MVIYGRIQAISSSSHWCVWLGDAVITTPLVRHLKKKGNEIYFLGSDRSEVIMRNNPNVDKFILHKQDSVENDKLSEYFEKVAKENDCHQIIDLCESIEVSLAVSKSYPMWNWSKEDRKKRCNRNYYEFTFEKAGMFPPKSYLPELFFTEEEENYIMDFRKKLLGQKIIMWGLSGSSRQKTYPYVPYVVGDIVRERKDVTFILVGGNTCKILECAFPKHNRIMKMSGEFNLRQSALMAKYADLVISPDTGFLHCAGCWETPKIGLLTHSTKENITKHFKNDYSIESRAVCAPCFRLIDDPSHQCIIEPETKACLCMTNDGIDPKDIYEKINELLEGE